MKVHDLLMEKGKQLSLLDANSDRERNAIITAANYLSDESVENLFFYSGWAMAGLPHRRLADSETWRVDSDHVTLLVEPGRKPMPGGANPFVGVPYGSRARLILLYLQTEALRSKSREVELGGNMNRWMLRLGIPVGGRSREDVRRQAERISRCRMSFTLIRQGQTALVNQNILDSAIFGEDADAKGYQILNTARLSEGFYAQLLKHPVPVEETAIRNLNNSSMALDIYCWLAYRLHILQRPTSITWTALKQQFGAGFKEIKHFKPTFLDNFALAMAVYPAAKVDAKEEGLTLHPSASPVEKRVTAAPKLVLAKG